ncbi:MAG: MFS transporter [Anaerolineae bacterium]|nr:MFS transporter [Anaerolineae bacterium]
MKSGTWHKIAYGFGSLGTALSYQTFNNRFQFLYLDELRVAPQVFGVIWFVYGLWNAINDPLMGQLSDNTRTSRGRRIPYILFGSLPLAVMFALLWLPPRGADTVVLLLYMVATLFIFDTLWSLIVIAWTALFPEMWPDLNERAEAAGWREVFSLIGVLLALGLSPIVIDRIGWAGMAVAFGIVTLVAFLISLLGSSEKPALHRGEATVPFLQGLKLGFANPSFRWFLVANLAKELIFLIMVAMMPFYAKYALRLTDIPGGLDKATQESVLLAVPFILSIPAMFVWTKITQGVGSRMAWIYTSLALMPGLLTLLVAPNFTVALLGMALLVLGFPGLLMLYNIVLSDVIDQDELLNGHRREGFFFGMNGAVIRLAFSGQALLTTTLLPLAGYDPALRVQPVAVTWVFRFLLAGVPILASLVTIWALSRYPLHGVALMEMRSKLAESQQMKAAASGTD